MQELKSLLAWGAVALACFQTSKAQECVPCDCDCGGGVLGQVSRCDEASTLWDDWDPGCGEGCDAMWDPGLTVTADAILMDRRDPGSTVLVFNTANPAQNLNAADFHFSVQAGFDIALAMHLDHANSLELRYFGIDHWHTTAIKGTTPGNVLQVNAAVPVFTAAGGSLIGDYASQLHSAEVNARSMLTDWLDVLAGFRCVELDEYAAGTVAGAAVPVMYEVWTRNRLYGLQFGGQAWILHHGSLTVDAFGKIGVFNNQSAQDGSIRTGAVMLPVHGRGSPAAFLGEVGVGGKMQLTEHLSLRGGYRMLWIDRVALASDQLAASNFVTAAGYNGRGDVFYHGAFAGLELAY